MANYKYEIKKNSAINRWWLSKINIVDFKSPQCTFESEINYSESYVDRVYPVREAFFKQQPIDGISVNDAIKEKKVRLYIPFDNNRVEGTAFYHTPKYVHFTGETFLFVEESCDLEFDLYTCGGIKLWLRETLVEDYRPYTRNQLSKKRIILRLAKGLNRLVIYADDLAERDVQFQFELRYMNTIPLQGQVVIDESVEEVYAVEKFLSTVYFENDLYYSGPIEMTCIPNLLQRKVEASLSYLNAHEQFANETIMIEPEMEKIPIDELIHLPTGMHRITIDIKLGTVNISRSFIVGSYSEDLLYVNKGSNIDYRKRTVLALAASDEHYKENTLLAILEIEGKMTDKATTILYRILQKVNDKADNSVLFVGVLLLLLKKYKALITMKQENDIKSAILSYRYWIDEPGNDTMWYFSETHSLHFHIAQYLSGSCYKSECFEKSQRLGEEQANVGKKRLMEWFNHFLEYGYGDWNAIAHMPTNISGFLYLYEMAEDHRIRAIAEQCLDFTFRQITYHNYRGKLSSTYGRAYEYQLISSEMTEAAYLSWINNGEGYINNSARAVILFALSGYTPLDARFEVALQKGESVAISVNQGIKNRSIYSYKSSDYMISSTQNFPAYVKGHQQHLMNVALGKGIQCFINHPGERVVGGLGRPSYWAGNDYVPMIRQYRNVIMMHFKIPEKALVHYIHCYMPKARIDEVVMKKQSVYARSEEGYLAMKFIHPIRMQTKGPTVNREIICDGLEHYVYVKCSSAVQWNDFIEFVNTMESVSLDIDEEETMRVKDPEYGAIVMDKDARMSVDEVPVSIYEDHEIMIERIKLNEIGCKANAK